MSLNLQMQKIVSCILSFFVISYHQKRHMSIKTHMKGKMICVKERLFKAIVKHRKGILVFFLLAAIIAAICKPLVKINYDMSDYLPEESPSTVAIDVMQEEYDGDIPNARVMLKNVSMGEALAFKEKLKAIDGVTDVLWLDDVASVEEPLETQDKETVENYYKANAI